MVRQKHPLPRREAGFSGAVKNLVSDTTRETEVIVVIDLAFREMVSDTKCFTAPFFQVQMRLDF